MPIAFGPGEFFAAQKVYFRGISEPIDSLCHFSAENLCLLKYLEDEDALTAKVYNNLTESAEDNLCSSWPNERILAKKFADISSVLRAFNHWIYFMAPINSQVRLIVRSWVEQFVLRTAHNANGRCWWDWPEFDLALFQEIGLFFTNARNAFSLTSEKLAQIDGIKQLLNSVCDNIKNAWGPCPQHSAAFAILQQWNTAVCVNGKLRYKAAAWRRGCCEIASPSSRKRSHQQTQLDNINNSNENEKNGKKCIICLEGERQFAFDPCGHLCCCEECADKIEKNEPEPNCPICREIIDKKIRIFHP
ncbi:hypothetical protein niasHT_025051 [Heterodera trifolii]|uniref:RING-type domain-containing protein n=1 Tax=Heterodera trifolii TaxID=157864 RepID=A0ABD2KKW6_9BILA